MNYYDTPIAHRGLHGSNGIIENTTSAFKLAIEKGYTIELDVKLLKDGKAVVFHDANLKRLLEKCSHFKAYFSRFRKRGI
ncbi:MAG: hypothetical protein FWD49_07660 [Firmicutes bacterium]|nr:hypothetical protein [Bacillota bacterium]